MERITFDYSLKNIPIAGCMYYKLSFIESEETLIRNMRWSAFFYLNPKERVHKETYSFRSRKAAPAIAEMKEFESGMAKMVNNLEFSNRTNQFQQQMKRDIRNATSKEGIIIAADKTTNLYRLSINGYKDLLGRNVQKEYKKTTRRQISNMNKADKKLAERIELADRLETIAEKECFITAKDHKPNFENNPCCRLLNPTKSELQRISKVLLENLVKKTSDATQINLWRNTYQVINWFNQVRDKSRAKFISFDIVNFYPSIKKKLFTEALEFACNYANISDVERDIIFQAKKVLLFKEKEPWTKKQEDETEEPFDIPMGAHDGAESCELVVCYLLYQLRNEIKDMNMGLYRDDGLGVVYGSPRQVEIIKKKITKVFSNNQLRITIEANQKIVHFLDVTFDLNTSKHRPYLKPGNTPQYVHVQSNHPACVIKAIPEGVNKRLSEISSDETEFDKAKKPYQDALNKSGHKYKLEYKQYAKKTGKRNKSRKITWFNPPFNLNLITNVGKEFLSLVDSCFPVDHPLRKIFNRNTLKISYRCTPSVKSAIDGHNKKQLRETPEPTRPCGGHRGGLSCPLNGDCHRSNIVYQAEVSARKQGRNGAIQTRKDTYIGMTSTDFMLRYANHKFDANNENMKNRTALSRHIWKLKKDEKDNWEYEVKWRIMDSAPVYSNKTKRCRLCLLEKYYIICHPKEASLNQMCGLVNSCVHRNAFTLSNHPG